MTTFMYTDQLALYALREAQRKMEFAINATSTGDTRNRLCEINIELMAEISKIEDKKLEQIQIYQ